MDQRAQSVPAPENKQGANHYNKAIEGIILFYPGLKAHLTA